MKDFDEETAFRANPPRELKQSMKYILLTDFFACLTRDNALNKKNIHNDIYTNNIFT